MKPHITRCAGIWRCEGDGSVGYSVFSVKQAHQSWAFERLRKLDLLEKRRTQYPFKSFWDIPYDPHFDKVWC